MKENYTSRGSPILLPRTRPMTNKPPMRKMKVRCLLRPKRSIFEGKFDPTNRYKLRKKVSLSKDDDEEEISN
jgi:CRISPR/Cas system-associated endoribonuclease Cas2